MLILEIEVGEVLSQPSSSGVTCPEIADLTVTPYNDLLIEPIIIATLDRPSLPVWIQVVLMVIDSPLHT